MTNTEIKNTKLIILTKILRRITSSTRGPGADREGEVPGGGTRGGAVSHHHPGQRHQDWSEAPPATAGLSTSTRGG